MTAHRNTSIRSGLTALTAALAVFGAAASSQAELTEDEKTFYYLGVAMEQSLKTFGLSQKELALVLRGLNEAYIGDALELDQAAFNQKLQMLSQERMAKQAVAEKAEADKFLAKAGKRKGAVTTESGLIYIETVAGTGDSPSPTSTVKVHYHGTMRDGTVFDSSVERGQPAEFPLNRVIPCWTEGVGKMKPGGKATLICPPEIAYGERGSPPRIPGNSALAFDVELIEIK